MVTDREYRRWPISLSIALLFLLGVAAAHAQKVRERDDVSRLLTLDKVKFTDGLVSGEVVNRSPYTLRNVQLFIRYTWLWDNETKPGANDPGRSAYITLPQEIQPGGHASFNFRPSPPLATMAGGHFEHSVAIAGFSEVIPTR